MPIVLSFAKKISLLHVEAFNYDREVIKISLQFFRVLLNVSRRTKIHPHIVSEQTRLRCKNSIIL